MPAISTAIVISSSTPTSIARLNASRQGIPLNEHALFNALEKELGGPLLIGGFPAYPDTPGNYEALPEFARMLPGFSASFPRNGTLLTLKKTDNPSMYQLSMTVHRNDALLNISEVDLSVRELMPYNQILPGTDDLPDSLYLLLRAVGTAKGAACLWGRSEAVGGSEIRDLFERIVTPLIAEDSPAQATAIEALYEAPESAPESSSIIQVPAWERDGMRSNVLRHKGNSVRLAPYSSPAVNSVQTPQLTNTQLSNTELFNTVLKNLEKKINGTLVNVTHDRYRLIVSGMKGADQLCLPPGGSDEKILRLKFGEVRGNHVRLKIGQIRPGFKPEYYEYALPMPQKIGAKSLTRLLLFYAAATASKLLINLSQSQAPATDIVGHRIAEHWRLETTFSQNINMKSSTELEKRIASFTALSNPSGEKSAAAPSQNTAPKTMYSPTDWRAGLALFNK
jgi:hypothetical protein